MRSVSSIVEGRYELCGSLCEIYVSMVTWQLHRWHEIYGWKVWPNLYWSSQNGLFNPFRSSLLYRSSWTTWGSRKEGQGIREQSGMGYWFSFRAWKVCELPIILFIYIPLEQWWLISSLFSAFFLRYLTEVVFKKPVIVYNYPKGIKAFYMRLNDDMKTVAAMDVLVPKVVAYLVFTISLMALICFTILICS